MNYFRCTVGGSGKGNTVTVTCAEEFAGLTITLAKTGKTYTKTCPSTAPYVVTFYGVENGTYTVSCTVDGQTYSETVVVQDVSCVLNYGFNWKIWVGTASQLDSSDYDSLDEVLADEEALRELFLEHACVDYMASMGTSNEDLETVINNDLCAKWINLSDYALDYLYANEIIADLMDEADKYGYGEWALMPQVPTMTSNTAPYGEAFASTMHSTYQPYTAFDNDASTQTSVLATNGIWYIGYHFVTPIKPGQFLFRANNQTASTARLLAFTLYIDGSNDGTTWEELYSHAITQAEHISYQTTDFVDSINADTTYAYLRFRTNTNNYNYNNITTLSKLQFYAWGPKGNVPVMTSNTAPYGEVISDTTPHQSYYLYNAFDNNPSTKTVFMSSVGATPRIAYKFTNPICVRKIKWVGNLDSPYLPPTIIQVVGSNDGVIWENIDSQITNIPADTNEHEQILSNDKYYLYIGAKCTNRQATTNQWYTQFSSLQFYGRELKVSVPVMTSNTAPYGEAFGDAKDSQDYYVPFDGDDTTLSAFAISKNQGDDPTGKYFAYDFIKSIVPKGAYIKTESDSNGIHLNGYAIEGSNDKSTWVEIYSSTMTTAYVCLSFVSNTMSYRYIRLKATNKLDNGYAYPNCGTFQIYGFDYSEKEFEVGATKKWLYDHGLELETLTKYTSGTGAIAQNQNGVLSVGVGSGGGSSSYGNAHFSIDFTPYSLMRGKVAGATINTLCGGFSISDGTNYPTTHLAVANFNSTNLPNCLGLDISSVNATSNGFAFSQTAANRIMDIVEWWLE